MDTLWHDLRYGLRMLIKNPGLTIAAALSLSLGIGANTSIFSIVNAVMLRPLPYQQPDQLMTLFLADAAKPDGKPSPYGKQDGKPSPYWSYPKFEAVRNQSQSFEQVAAFAAQAFSLTGAENAERVEGEFVSASYFPLLGIEAALGRTFLPEEDQTPSTHPVALIGYGLWQRRFGSHPEIVGKTITLRNVVVTVVGVLPEGFKGQAGTAEIWVPMMMAPVMTFPRRLSAPFSHWHEAIARLKPGVTVAQAQAEMQSVARQMEETVRKPANMPAEEIKLLPLREANLDPAIKRSLLILLAAVGFVLLIACVNVANLLMARSVTRQKEIAVRLALGATRARLMRQLLTESVVLALLGGLLGWLVAMWTNDLLAAFKPTSNPAFRAKDVMMLNFAAAGLDGQVLGFNLLLSVLTGLLFGLVPALQTSRPDVNETLKEGAGKGARLPRRFTARRLLVSAEIALSLVLLISAGLMIKSFAKLNAVKPGFEPDRLLTLKIDLPRGYNAPAFQEQLLARAATLPGVEAASVATTTPLSSSASSYRMTVEGRPPQSGEEGQAIGVHDVGPAYFKTLRIPLRRGRTFTPQDREGAQRVAIISETAARRFWPNEDPIGQRVNITAGWPAGDRAEIIGIVGDVKYGKVEEEVRPDLYLSHLQPVEGSPFLIIRAANDPKSLVAAVRQEVQALDKNLPVYDIKTMAERIGDATSRTRFGALLLGIFAGLALMLAAVGIYGVMSYAIFGRTREIGIRLALGAEQRDVLRLVMSEGLILTAVGLIVGLAAAFAATGVLSSLLFEVSATDPAIFTLIAVLLTGVAMLACYVPARRAMKVDPVIALRSE
jgi:predicted permease